VPESRSSSRNTHGAPVRPPPAEGGGGAAELRLRVLRSLPETHLRWLFREIRVLCENYLRRWHVPAAEVTPDELVSEIWQKLLGTVSLSGDETEERTTTLPPEWSINPDVPKRDDRVLWLINEIGGSAAIAHRHEDLRRQRHGRFQHGRGRQTTQLGDADEPPEAASDPAEPDVLHHLDAQRIWRGLLITANLRFQAHDDVLMLLRVMDDVRDILDEPSGHWPIKRTIDLLNKRFPSSSWTDDRVDNAKRRLQNWIKQLRQKHGFDTTDLQGLFARVARKQERGERVLPPESGARNVN
jgi:hypothetical protein